MAKSKRKWIRMRVEEESSMSRDALTKKLDDLIDSQYRKNLKKMRGAQMCLWQKAAEDCYKLKFYHSYGTDMCDLMMTVDIEKGLERCSVHGMIHKPPGIWAVFWGVIASVFIDFLIITWMLLFSEGFDLMNGLMISGAVCLVRIYVCLSLIEIERGKAVILRQELLRVIRDLPEGTDLEAYFNNIDDDEEDENENSGEQEEPNEQINSEVIARYERDRRELDNSDDSKTL